MSSSNSRFLKQLSSNLRGLAFFLGPKLAARSPAKPVKDFPADHCYGVLYIVEGFVLSFGHTSVQIEKDLYAWDCPHDSFQASLMVMLS